MFLIDEKEDGHRVVKGVPVVVKTVQDNGAQSKATLTLDYKILPTDESDAIIENGDDLLETVIVGWGGVKNATDQVVDFSEAVLRIALKKPNFRNAALSAYFRTAAGEKPRKGN